ncbi:MAG: SAM-dependent DNA methyltransferase, partial [Clostridiales bacterium]|nr:SAM-dependent DNA methyltransferase [Clostridiales bacterium]
MPKRASSYCIKICRNIDPACGSGNFLIITYQELRKLEFEVMKLLYEGHQMAWVDTLIK